MGWERFRRTGEGSFFGELIYQRAVPQEHFLRKRRELLPWESLTQQRVALPSTGSGHRYKGEAEYGPPPYHPSVVLKMFLLTYLYNLSERQVELFINDSLSANVFGIWGPTSPAPTAPPSPCSRDDCFQLGARSP